MTHSAGAEDAVAIIPARAGSKRIPGKNIRAFLGKPMIQYSIEAALHSGLFARVLVSTDSEEISELARSLGAEVPFQRPPAIADDRAPLADVIHHALTWLADAGQTYAYTCCILATAPLLQQRFLKRGDALIRAGACDSVVPVTTYAYPIFRSFKLQDGHLAMMWPEHELTRSNDLVEAYHDIGQFYWLRSEAFLRSRRIFAANAQPILVPRNLVQDIDTEEDWQRAESIFKSLREPEAG